MDTEQMDEAHRKMMQFIAEHLQRGDTASMFQELYVRAQDDMQVIPWARQQPNPLFVSWAEQHDLAGNGRRALQVGCGLGDDAEELARRGFVVTAFDIAPAAIEWCRRRFPDSPVQYMVADLLNPPEDWRGAFDLILEIYTLQTMPAEMRAQAVERLTRFLAPGGELLVICRGRHQDESEEGMPPPLAKEDLALFERCGLQLVSFEDIEPEGEPSWRRFRALYRA
ncbi:MAG TPA: class I SAM-dependent methyltransferase [Ktedonobacteraceae bacterium]|nr:class I SAM-dependent methyltransferase [Ktedonobacteraceae bacterium]